MTKKHGLSFMGIIIALSLMACSTQNNAGNELLSELMDNIGKVEEDVFEDLKLEEGQDIDLFRAGMYQYQEEQILFEEPMLLILNFDLDNRKMYGFEFIKNYEEFDQDGYDLALRLYEEFNELHGEPTTYPGLLGRISNMPDYEDLSFIQGKQYQESWQVNEDLDVTLRMYVTPSDQLINVAVQYKVNPESW